MKLRAKMHQRNSSKFHALMKRGFSVQLFCIKGCIKEDEAHAMISEKGADKVDYKMLWIGSFHSNT